MLSCRLKSGDAALKAASAAGRVPPSRKHGFAMGRVLMAK